MALLRAAGVLVWAGGLRCCQSPIPTFFQACETNRVIKGRTCPIRAQVPGRL